MPGYLRPTGPIAACALLPADPGHALALAQQLLVKPLMANHNHGLWGYTGATATGLELTIQASGVGAASADAVLGELIDHGARGAIRIGTCVAIDDRLGPADVVVASAAIVDRVGRPTDEPSRPEPALLAALERRLGSAAIAGTVASSDLVAGLTDRDRKAAWRERGAVAVDLETAAVLALGARRGIAVASALLVAGGDDAELGAGLLDLGASCADALAQVARPDQRSASGTGTPA